MKPYTNNLFITYMLLKERDNQCSLGQQKNRNWRE